MNLLFSIGNRNVKKIFILLALPFLLASCATEEKIPRFGVEPYLQFPQPPYENLPQPAFEIRFHPEKKGNYAETYFEVPDKLSGRQFSFKLRYYKRENDSPEYKERVNKLVGGMEVDANGIPKKPGVIRQIRLRQYSVDGNKEEPIYDKILYAHVTGGGGGVLDQIVEFKILNKGIYKVRVDTVKDTPELADVFITFMMSYAAK